MNFNSKDLMLNLTELIADNTRTCRMTPPPTGPVTGFVTIKGAGTVQSLVALAVLKSQLKGQLKAIESEECALQADKDTTPEQLAEAAKLADKVEKAIKKLEKALDEVINAK